MSSTDHADLLATKWWSGEEFTAQGGSNSILATPLLIRILGVTFIEGPFEQAESNRITDAIRVYGEVRLM